MTEVKYNLPIKRVAVIADENFADEATDVIGREMGKIKNWFKSIGVRETISYFRYRDENKKQTVLVGCFDITGHETYTTEI